MTAKPFNTVFAAKSIRTAAFIKTAGTYDMTLQTVKQTHTATSGTPCLRVTFINTDKTLMTTDSVLLSENGVIGFDKYARLAKVNLEADEEIDLLATIESLKGRVFKVTCDAIEDGRVVVRNVELVTSEARKLMVVSTNAIKPASAKDAG